MTPRERVMEALAHRTTDRAPADYGAHGGVTEALIRRLGVQDAEELLQALHVDMRRIGAHYIQPDTGPDADGYYRNMWGLRYRKQDPGDDRPMTLYPFDEATAVDEVNAHPWPDPAALDFSGVRAECERHHGTYATFGAPWSPFFHEVGWLVGQENLFVWMATRPDLVQAVIDRVVDYEVEATRRFLEAAAGGIDIAYFGNDFGTQRGLVFSPGMFEQFYRRPLKRFYDMAHDFGCKVMQHSCGAVRELIPMWMEDGVDILDPLQPLADGMDFDGLVRDFGRRIVFHGGIDTQRLLPFGTESEIRAVVRRCVRLAQQQGGYILCGSQEYIEDIPLDHILAIYDENARMGGESAAPACRSVF